MNLSGLLALFRHQSAFHDLVAGGLPRTGITALNLVRASRPFVTASLAAEVSEPVLVITSRADRAANFAEQLLAWQPALNVMTFPEPNAMFYERAPWGPRTTLGRLQVLAELSGSVPTYRPPAGTVIVTSARALMQRTLPREFMDIHTMTVTSGTRLPVRQPDALLKNWLHMGYEPAAIVTEPGTFSRRGGIIDVFPVASPRPARIELWGDEVESIRSFDPATQRSRDAVQTITISPAREALPVYGLVAAAKLKDWFKSHITDENDNATDDQRADMQPLLQQQSFDTIEFYLPWMVQQEVSLLDYLSSSSLVLVDDMAELSDMVADLEEQALGLRDDRLESEAMPPAMPLPFITWVQLADELEQAQAVDLSGTPDMLRADDDPRAGLDDLFAPGSRFAGELKPFLEHIRDLSRPAQDNVIVVSRQAERLAGLWYELGSRTKATPVDDLLVIPEPGVPVFVQGALAEGWSLYGSDRVTHLITDAEIFGWRRPEPRRRRQPRAIAPEDFFADLSPGDYVVHVEHGIGRFRGLEKRTLAGADREFLLLEYGGGNLLYVPIHQADRMSRYIGSDDSSPELSRLGGVEWSRAKERTRRAVEEAAGELLELYAKRETIQGFAFAPDTPWQHELEASFPYVETEDQLRALAEVKVDMEQVRPMDRLICGDVGYGKTEVALRAAFKAVMSGKQVAMLVPTTILAQQHYDTFSRRMAAFPVKVEMLSRFRTRAEQDTAIKGLSSGKIDIVIGTHRLLSDDVMFENLGLLIVDEEQRFGVTHKEQLKQLRTEVDVLTLTATPIPRTLWMSLTGVRDISVIDTAPEERLPIRTYVGRRDDDLIRKAVLFELDRGGQVFYVHNRVQTIYTEVEKLKKLVPEARFGFGHGQMNESQLESVMMKFSEGEIDVLVSTSIIEAGIDFPNANTLVVDRADWFGLSQLYQLRGRVGRSANRAFAYFFHPAHNRLTDEARARLETIAEYTDLGVGMNIAMRDLEIRGAGDILSVRQSGHISAVGFHLYTRMLADAVKRLRSRYDSAEPTVDDVELPREVVTIDLPLPTYIPTDFVPDIALRIQLYRRMADLRSDDAIRDFSAELADRFGPLPAPVENLLFQLRVKYHALHANVEAVVNESEQISIRIAGLAHVDRGGLQRRLGHNVRVSRTAVWLPPGLEEWQTVLVDVLSQLAEMRLSGVDTQQIN